MKKTFSKILMFALTIILFSPILPAHGSSASGEITFSSTPQDIKVEVAKRLNLPELGRFGRVSKEFNAAMQSALTEFTVHIKASQLTAENVVTLRMAGTLNLKVDDASDASMKRIGQLTNLKTLVLAQTAITDEGMSNLKNLTNLESLNLLATNISDRGIANLEGLTQLKSLNLVRTGLTNAGVTHLKNLTKLERLHLGNTQVNDEGLANLVGLQNLQILGLGGTSVTAAGLLKYLPEFKNLKHLNLVGGMYISDQDMLLLKKELPTLDIFRHL